MASEKRLIDANAFRQSLEVDRFGCTDIVKVNIALDKSTVDAVEVVRCKDCENWRAPWLVGQTLGWCCAGKKTLTEPNHFCSYGERKDNG